MKPRWGAASRHGRLAAGRRIRQHGAHPPRRPASTNARRRAGRRRCAAGRGRAPRTWSGSGSGSGSGSAGQGQG
eukprot:scaffold138384_cov145-Phaeocystis_antarctica.AAC.1